MTDRTVVLYLESREIGGTELALLHLAAALRSVPGWRPMICHHDRPELRPVIERARSIGIDVLTLPSLEGPLPAAVIRLARAIGQIEPDVFHAHLPWPAACRRGLFAATVARVPAVVATAHLYLPVADLLNRAAVRLTRVDRYIAVSEAVAHGLCDLGIDRRRIRVIHNAGAAALDGGALVPQRRPPDGRPTIAAVGRLTEQKGYPVLLEALVGLPDVSLLVAGDGPLRTELEETVRRLDLAGRVEFLGNVDDVSAVLSRAHVFVLTSLNEGLPLVVVEAMRAGLPVVATRVGGTPEAVIEGETGLLVDPGDVTGTRLAISRLLDDLDLAERLGRRGQQVAQAHFSVEGMVNGVVDVYEELLAGAADSPRPWRRRPKIATHLLSEAETFHDPLGTEASRNAVLRRADWRFLLPDPSPRRTVCYCDGRLLRATRAISGEILFPGDRLQEPDLAVVVNPDPGTLKSALQALRPGGICYSEWHGLRPMTRGGVTRRLTEAGFGEIRTYWPWPGLSGARAWLPLDSRAGIRYYLSTRAARRTLAGRTIHGAVRGLLQRTLGKGLATPIVAVARKPDPASDTGPAAGSASWLAPIDPGWIEAAGGRPSAGGWLLLTGGPRTISKAVALAFAEPHAAPRLAVKMNRTSEARAGIVHEAEMLRFIERERPALAGVPRSRGLVGRGALVLLAESPVVGRSLDAELSAATFSQHANDVTDWLLALAGRTPPVTREAWWSRLIEPVLSTFRAEFGSVLDEGDLEGGLAALKDLPDLPLVPEQRDMGPWNLVLGRDGIGVLDWESAEPSGLPVLDLIYFLVYAAFHVAGARQSDNLLDTYRAVRTPTTLLGRVARDCLVRYCRGLEVPPGVLHQLHLLTWMIHAQSEHRRLVEDAGGPPTQRALRSALLPALWQAEMSLRDLT